MQFLGTDLLLGRVELIADILVPNNVASDIGDPPSLL
jgi:hypothetical protein